MNRVFYNPNDGYWYIRDLNIRFVSDNEAYEYLQELEELER